MAERARSKRRSKSSAGNGERREVAVRRSRRMGDNGPPGLSEDEKRTEMNRLNRFHVDWQRDLTVSRQSKGVYDAAKKAARKRGLDVRAYEAARDFHAADHGSTVLHFAHTGEYLRIMKSPLAVQMDLFQNIQPRDFTGEAAPGEEAQAA